MHVAAAFLVAQALTGGVDLVWVDPARVAPFAYDAARLESIEILREAGVAAHWRRGAPTEVLRPDEVAVVILPGSAPQSRPSRRVMGAAQKGEDAVAAVWIYVPEVKWTLGLAHAPIAAWSGAQRAAFGRALGRVAAHETIHALLPRLPHAATGLMSAQIDRTALLARRLPVDARTRAALRERAAEAPLEPASASLTQDGNVLEPLDLATKAHLLAASPSLHGRGASGVIPSAPCHTSSDPFRRAAPATSSAETLPVNRTARQGGSR
jgi:hypothetical protein